MHSLSYTTSGPRKHPAVLFLHGFMGSSGDWKNIVAALDDRFYCVVPDLPGHGAALGLPPEQYSMRGAADYVLRTLDELGVERARGVVGYSMGGRLGLYLALRHPERFSGLFLESASPGLKTERERAARRRSDEERARTLETGDFEEFLSDWYARPLFSTLPDTASMARDRLYNDPAELARSLRGMGTGSQPSLWDEMPGLEISTLAVAGELDEKFTRIAREMEAASPRLRAEVTPGAGHNIHVEEPGEFAMLLEQFLTERNKGL